jgi:hypothetical protein
MNSLTKVLLEDVLEAEKKKVTAIYGGGFKPPTKGHYNVVQKAAEQNPEIDDFIIFVGGGERDGITQGESIQVWELYKKYLPLKVRIEPAKAPIGDILKYAKEHPDEEILWVIGARENNPEDFADIASRTRTIDKYPNLELRVIQTAGGVSGTATRKAIKDNNKEQFFYLIPDIKEKEQVWDIVSPVIKEGFIGDIKTKLSKFISAVKQENQETKEAVSLLIKAAQGKIELTDKNKEYIGNQLKDVLKLIGLTAIAALPGGSIAFILIKLFKAESLITPSSFATEGTCGYDTDVSTDKKLDTPGGLEEADPKKGTGKKPEGSGRRLYTDEDPKDTVGISFKTKEDIVDTLNKKSFKAKSHARQSQIINLIHQRVRAAYGKAKDPEVKTRLKRGLDYIESRKEASKEKTQRLKNLKEVVTNTEVICDNCGWKWDKEDGGDDLYVCHKCGHDNTPTSLKEGWNLQDAFVSLSKFMMVNGMNITPLPKIKTIPDDKENASNLLGKTAYYNPTEKSITLFTMDRHPKDILRSFAHEMVHHEQNLEGKLNNINTTNTNEDGDLSEVESEAYEKGNIMLRNWEDSIKNV